MEFRLGGGKSERAGSQPLLEQICHLHHLILGRRPLTRCCRAHHIGAQRTVRHLHADIDGVVHRAQRVHEFRETFPAPVDAFVQCSAGDVLDAFHQFDQIVMHVRSHRGEANATVTHHDGGHPMPARWPDQRVPRHLAVVMSVHIDPARLHQRPSGINLTRARPSFATNLRDGVAVDRKIPRIGACPRAVDNCSAANDQIVHHAILLKTTASVTHRQNYRQTDPRQV